MREPCSSRVGLFGRAFFGTLGAALSAALVAGCGSVVVVDRGGGGGTPEEQASESSGDPGTGNAGTEGETSDFELTCADTGGGCSSAEYPAGETCEECFCRCCNVPDLMAQCEAEPACMEYVECLIGCDGDSACIDGCNLPCPTGTEAACYLEDCRNWMCAHTCGEYP